MPRGVYNRNKSRRTAAKAMKAETKTSARNQGELVFRMEVKVWNSGSEDDAEYMRLSDFETFRQTATRFKIPLTEDED